MRAFNFSGPDGCLHRGGSLKIDSLFDHVHVFLNTLHLSEIAIKSIMLPINFILNFRKLNSFLYLNC